MKVKKEIVFLVLTLALGIFLRLYQINSIPPGLHGDEAQSGLEALKILNGAPYSPYSSEVFGQTTLYFYWMALIFKLFGTQPFAIRLTSAIIGIATLPVFYFLLKKVSSTKVALIATFLLAASRWHLHLSRLGFMTVLMTLFQALCFFPLILGLKRKKPVYFLFAGAFLGLGLNTYMAFRFIPLAVLPTLIYYWFITKQAKRQKLINLSLFLSAGIILALPLLNYAFQNWDIFMGRMRSIWIFGQPPEFKVWSAFKQNLVDTLLMFNYRGSLWPHKNLPGAPMLDFLTGGFFLLGILIVLRKIKSNLNLLLVSNLIIMSLVSVFSITYYPQSGGDPIRSSGALFSVIIIASLGLKSLSHFFKKTLKSKIRLISFSLLLLTTASLNIKAYFVQFAQSPAVWHDFFSLPVSIAQEAKKYSPQNYHFYLLSNWIYGDYLSIRFIAPHHQIQNHFTKINQYSPLPPAVSNHKSAVYFVLPFYEKYLEDLKSAFPQGNLSVKKIGPKEYYYIFKTSAEKLN